MTLAVATTLLPLTLASGYLLLIGYLYLRGRQKQAPGRYLLYYLVVSLLWLLFVTLTPPDSRWANLPANFLAAGSLLLIVTTAAYAEWPRQWILPPGAVALVALIVSGVMMLGPPLDGPLVSMLAVQPKVAGVGSLLLWLILNAFLAYRIWSTYRRTRLPGHANRLLYWGIAHLLIMGGEFLLFSRNLTAGWTGQTLRLLGAVALTNAVSSHRIFDVRGRYRRGLAVLIYAIVAAIPGAFVLVLVEQLLNAVNNPVAAFLLLMGAVTLTLILYRPFTAVVEPAIHQLILGEAFKANQVVRNYSQAISKTLNMEQLSLVIIGTISELLEINRGALMLVTKLDEGVAIEPIPAMGQMSRDATEFTTESHVIRTLETRHQPLLQYDVDFNPVFRHLPKAERDWLTEMAMEVYFPVSTGAELTGLIALGPKSSGLPYLPGELDLVQLLADQTVIALQNARLYSTLESQNDTVRLLNADLRRQNERLEVMDQVKTDFITIASHELRTPLTQVKGYADILAAMNDDESLTQEQTREIVGHINRASQQLEQLIAAMLDASQLDVEGINLTFVETRLETIVRLAIEPLVQAIRDRRLQLRLRGIRDLPPIQVDFKRLVQAFSNIIGNAVKYTPDGGTIFVEATLVPSEDKATEYIEVVIADTGIGIDPKFQELIFEKFFRIGDPQLHSTGATKFRGAGPGLGLPIARGVIEAHAGRIWVESEGEDEQRLPGSKFHIVLPVNPPALMQKVQVLEALKPAPEPDVLPARRTPQPV